MRMRAVPGTAVGWGWVGWMVRVSGGPKEEMRIAFIVWAADWGVIFHVNWGVRFVVWAGEIASVKYMWDQAAWGNLVHNCLRTDAGEGIYVFCEMQLVRCCRLVGLFREGHASSWLLNHPPPYYSL